MTNPKFWPLIVAAGVGKRMQSAQPKQYLTLLNQTVLEHSVNAFLTHPNLQPVTLVISPNDGYFADNPLSQNSKIQVVHGGAERADSVLNGLKHIAAQAHKNDYVLVHDGARACITHKELDELMHAANPDGAILAIPCTDSIKQSKTFDNGHSIIEKSLPRERIWRAQTPQLFPLGELLNALEQAKINKQNPTDEAQAMESQGYLPKLVEGSPTNIKITHPQDLALAEFYLTQKAKNN